MASAEINNSIDLFADSDDPDEHSQTEDAVIEQPITPISDSSSVDIQSFQCPFCLVNHQDGFHLQNHIHTYHMDFEKSISPINCITDLTQDKAAERSSELDISTLLCPYCDVSVNTKENLAKHFTEDHDDMDHKDLEEIIRSLDLFLCPLCLFVSAASTEMQTHFNDFHSDGRDKNGMQTIKEESQLSFYDSTVDAFIATCPVCGIAEPDPEELRSHVELHFDTPDYNSSDLSPSTSSKAAFITSVAAASSSSTSSSSSSSQLSSKYKGKGKEKRGKFKYQSQYKQNLERDVIKGKLSPGEYHEHISKLKEKDLNGEDEGHSKVDGLIEQLTSFYERHSRKDQQAFLCHPTDYFCGSYGDRGWGCGYRNFQMLLSCLARIPLYSNKLYTGNQVKPIPSVPKVQEMIEAAWRKGFDREGCAQLEAKVVNTQKWIGATEIVATLSSLGIKCQLIDFPRCSAPDGTHPRLVQWVEDYFLQSENAKPPLYLQHQGHSRTIIGVERDKGVKRLLLFDSGSSVEHISSLKSGLHNWKQLSTFRRNLAAFKAKQYQIVAVVGLLSGEEYERAKRLTSTRIM